ncbi:MAG: cytochrome b/b6 domain-containing protein [Deltaproteobacteria bacterium]|nr:cytochrome b/b6 domain-containing protein [Deltaproteobacteria bacterium]
MNRESRGKGGKIRRFSTFRIVEHWGIILTTMILFATGLCQRFWHLELSQWFILKLGGIDNVRLIHRYTGILFSLELLMNISVGMMGVVRGKWQPSMFITRKDYEDAIHNIKYYFGFENHPAKCDRYDYMEKFEYWTILVGGILMIMTGIILWFPTLVTRILPGEFIPTAKALHSNEAMLIFLLNAVWHIYNAIFSPEVFPLDTSIFTGYISRERMIREHPLELARMEGVTPEELEKDNPGKIRDLKVEASAR